MSLTKQDLKSIKSVVKSTVNDELKPVKQGVKANSKMIQANSKAIKANTRHLKFIRESLNATIENFEIEDSHIKHRLSRVESHLGLPG